MTGLCCLGRSCPTCRPASRSGVDRPVSIQGWLAAGRDQRLISAPVLVCGLCLRDDMRIAGAHEQLARIHRAAHGFDDPCPTCAADAWLAGQKAIEAVEMRLEQLRVEAMFTADRIRLP